MTTWEPCIDGKCGGVVRKHRDKRCEECGYAPAPVEAVRCADTIDMFGSPAEAPAQRHSPTSVAAAEKIGPALSQKRRDVLEHICENWPDGATDNEIIADLVAKGWSLNTPRARRVELVTGGWLEQDGERDGCAVWRPTDEAIRWYAAIRRKEAA